MKSAFVLLVAGLTCLITFFVVRRVFQEHLRIGPPSLLAASVVGLGFLGLTAGGEGMVTVILIPYAALVLTLALLFLLVNIARLGRPRSRITDSREPNSGEQAQLPRRQRTDVKPHLDPRQFNQTAARSPWSPRNEQPTKPGVKQGPLP
jgi:hypothetical protein